MRKIGLALILFALILAGAPLVQAQAQKPAGELKIALPTLYDQTFHPLWATAMRKQYFEPMYDYIIGVNKDGKFDPKHGVASKWEASPDLMSWTLTIKDGINFHNGDPLTAEDVKYTLEQAGSEKNTAGRRDSFKAFVDRVETTAPNKVVVRLKKKWPTFLYYLSTLVGVQGMVQPKKYIQEKGEDNFMKNPVGSGPYKFYEWKEGDYIKLVALDSHWRAVPRYKYLTFKLMPEEGTRDAALRAGEADLIAIGLSKLQGLQKAGFTIQQKKDGIFLDLSFLRLWREDWPTGKQKVRQALIHAIDKKEIVNKILMGQGQDVGTSVAMFTWSIEYKPYPPTTYDPKLAKKLLAEAGYPNGFTMHIYSFETGLPESKIINEAIANYWEAIGVKTKILEMDYSAFKPIWISQQEPPGPACFLFAWPNRPVYAWRDKYYSTVLYTQTKNPQLDRMIEACEAEATTEGFIAASRKIMDYVLENAYATGICTTHELYGMNKKIPNWEMGKGFSSYRWEYIGEK